MDRCIDFSMRALPRFVLLRRKEAAGKTRSGMNAR